MSLIEKRPEAPPVPSGRKGQKPETVKWRFADLGRKAGLGPNRSIHGGD